jgi:thiamine biosynthesis lipoprotein ApbE
VEEARVRFPVFGGEATVATADATALSEAQWIVEDELEAIDRACSRFRADSELAAVNDAGGRPTAVGPVFRAALAVALRAAALTDGDVDPTVGGAVRLLGYDRDFAALDRTGPPVVRVSRVPGWQVVAVDDDAGTVTVPPGVQLDLGATAKAYAADTAARRAADAVACGVLVGLGGDIAVAGPCPSGGWLVGLAEWHRAAADVTDIVRVDSGGVATSTTTVRRWSRGEEELHHLVDPRTGRPAVGPWRTVSVAAASCVDANIAATAAIVRGVGAPEWLARLELPARLVAEDGSVLCLCGWPAAKVA